VTAGGELTFGEYTLAARSAGAFVVPGDAAPTALAVGGRVDFAASATDGVLTVGNGGYVKLGDLTGTVVRDTNGAGQAAETRILPTNRYDAQPRIELTARQPVRAVGPTVPFDTAGAFRSFRATAARLAACPATVTLTDPGGEPFDGPIPIDSTAVVRLSPGITNVVRLTGTDLQNVAEFSFVDLPSADSPVVIDVDTTDLGDRLIWQTPRFTGLTEVGAPYLLWNFRTATSIYLDYGLGDAYGTLFAPAAHLDDIDPSDIRGAVVARTFHHAGGAIGYLPFVPEVACAPTPTATPTATPGATPTADPTAAPDPTVTPAGPVGPAQPLLPVTGGAMGPLLAIGVAAVGVGAAVLLLTLVPLRRRRG
jgi:choice-of-anchor A domain-containing protein